MSAQEARDYLASEGVTEVPVYGAGRTSMPVSEMHDELVVAIARNHATVKDMNEEAK